MANKALVEALIKALQETASFAAIHGATTRNKIIDKTNDATFVSGLVSDYGSDIEDIIDNIPDDPEPPSDPIDLYAKFGETVEVPTGYTVEGVYSKYFYKFADYYSATGGGTNKPQFYCLGADEYCDIKDKTLVGLGVSPCLRMFQIATATQPGTYTFFQLSYPSSQSPSSKPKSLTVSELNSNGYFVDFIADYTSGSGTPTFNPTLYPLGFMYYDENNTVVDHFFKIEQSVWKFENGTFSWLGDTTSTLDLAYYYSYQSIQYKIHCVPLRSRII